MFKKCLFLLSFLFSASLSSSQVILPELVDVDKLSLVLDRYATSIHPNAWTFGRLAFYQSPELIPFFGFLQQEYQIENAVETGTWKGESTALFAQLFAQVHTIEILEPSYLNSKKKLEEFPNVHCHLGSSPEVLSQLLPNLSSKPTIFYLDAHWHQYWPLLDELAEIAKEYKDNCIIVIDDVKVPQRPEIPYDSYGDSECSYEYVKEHLSKIFTDYTIHYLIPRHVVARAKLVVIPKVFRK